MEGPGKNSEKGGGATQEVRRAVRTAVEGLRKEVSSSAKEKTGEPLRTEARRDNRARAGAAATCDGTV